MKVESKVKYLLDISAHAQKFLQDYCKGCINYRESLKALGQNFFKGKQLDQDCDAKYVELAKL